MVQFATYQELRGFAATRFNAKGALVENTISQLPQKNVFLSHSSKDDALVPGVVAVLEGHGGRVYVDKRDPDLPKDDFRAVADRLRTAVKACPKFILFVTENSSGSKWIPWELGLGDGSHSPRNVALFPSAETAYNQSWANQEYLGLYSRVVWNTFEGEAKPCWMVWDHIKNSATRLSEWLIA